MVISGAQAGMLTRVSTWLHKRNSLLFIIRESGGILCPGVWTLPGERQTMDVVVPSHSHSTRALGIREMCASEMIPGIYYARQSGG